MLAIGPLVIPWYVSLAIMGFSMALSILLTKKPKANKPNEPNSWQFQTSQKAGAIKTECYGELPIYGNIITCYSGVTNTIHSVPDDPENVGELIPWILMKFGEWVSVGFDPIVFTNEDWYFIVKSQQTYYVRIAYGLGPIEGIVDGTERINDRPIANFTEVVVAHRRGLSNQTATGMGDRLEVIRGDDVLPGTPVTFTTKSRDFLNLAIIVVCNTGLIAYDDDDGDEELNRVGCKIEIRPVDGAWETLVDKEIFAKVAEPLREIYYADGSYEGGNPVSISQGTQYEIRVTSNQRTEDTFHRGTLTVESYQQIYGDDHTFPGLALTQLSAIASKHVSDYLEFRAIARHKIVPIWDDEAETWSYAWSRNNAWVWLSRWLAPKISGSGESADPYTLERYEGVDPSHINLDEVAELADWCDVQRPDGSGDSGSTEAQFEFDGEFDSPEERYQSAAKVLASCRANQWFDGNKVRIWIDRQTDPTFIACLANVRMDSYEEYSVDESKLPSVIEVDMLIRDNNYERQPVRCPHVTATHYHLERMDGFGVTRTSQIRRFCDFVFRKNSALRLVAKWSSGSDLLFVNPGHVGYVANDCNDLTISGRIVSVGVSSVVLDVTPEFEIGPSYKLVIMTFDVDGVHTFSYDVTGVEDNEVSVAGFDVTPNIGDVYIYAPANNLMKMRVVGKEESHDGTVSFVAEEYHDEYYDGDSDEPIADTDIHIGDVVSAGGSGRRMTQAEIEDNLPKQSVPGSIVRSRDITFQGDGVDTISWIDESGLEYGRIYYDGKIWPIVPADTTDEYIYFDPNASDPTHLQTTNSLSDLDGEPERFLGCVNKNGVAYPQNWIRVGADGTYVHIDDTIAGGMYTKSYQETFENKANLPAGHIVALSNPSVELSIEAEGGVTGGKFLRVGNNSGTDNTLVIAYKSIPFNTTGRLYRVRARIRRTAGSTTFSLGVAGRDETDGHWVNALGNDTTAYQCLCGPNEEAATGEWADYVGYFSGIAAEGDQDTHSHPRRPAALHADVRYVRALVSVNEYGAGTYDIDELVVEPVVPTAGEILPGAKAKVSNHSITLATDGYSERFTNMGATGVVVAELPPWVEGATYEFVRVADYAYRIKPKDGSGNAFRSGSLYYELLAVGDSVQIGAMESGKWDILAYAQPGAMGLALE